MTPPRGEQVRFNRSGFDFSCPSCGWQIHEEDIVFTLPVSALVTWPVCEACGMDWVGENLLRPAAEK